MENTNKIKKIVSKNKKIEGRDNMERTSSCLLVAPLQEASSTVLKPKKSFWKLISGIFRTKSAKKKGAQVVDLDRRSNGGQGVSSQMDSESQPNQTTTQTDDGSSTEEERPRAKEEVKEVRMEKEHASEPVVEPLSEVSAGSGHEADDEAEEDHEDHVRRIKNALDEMVIAEQKTEAIKTTNVEKLSVQFSNKSEKIRNTASETNSNESYSFKYSDSSSAATQESSKLDKIDIKTKIMPVNGESTESDDTTRTIKRNKPIRKKPKKQAPEPDASTGNDPDTKNDLNPQPDSPQNGGSKISPVVSTVPEACVANPTRNQATIIYPQIPKKLFRGKQKLIQEIEDDDITNGEIKELEELSKYKLIVNEKCGRREWIEKINRDRIEKMKKEKLRAKNALLINGTPFSANVFKVPDSPEDDVSPKVSEKKDLSKKEKPGKAKFSVNFMEMEKKKEADEPQTLPGNFDLANIDVGWTKAEEILKALERQRSQTDLEKMFESSLRFDDDPKIKKEWEDFEAQFHMKKQNDPATTVLSDEQVDNMFKKMEENLRERSRMKNVRKTAAEVVKQLENQMTTEYSARSLHPEKNLLEARCAEMLAECEQDFDCLHRTQGSTTLEYDHGYEAEATRYFIDPSPSKFTEKKLNEIIPPQFDQSCESSCITSTLSKIECPSEKSDTKDETKPKFKYPTITHESEEYKDIYYYLLKIDSNEDFKNTLPQDTPPPSQKLDEPRGPNDDLHFNDSTTIECPLENAPERTDENESHEVPPATSTNEALQSEETDLCSGNAEKSDRPEKSSNEAHAYTYEPYACSNEVFISSDDKPKSSNDVFVPPVDVTRSSSDVSMSSDYVPKSNVPGYVIPIDDVFNTSDYVTTSSDFFRASDYVPSSSRDAPRTSDDFMRAMNEAFDDFSLRDELLKTRDRYLNTPVESNEAPQSKQVKEAFAKIKETEDALNKEIDELVNKLTNRKRSETCSQQTDTMKTLASTFYFGNPSPPALPTMLDETVSSNSSNAEQTRSVCKAEHNISISSAQSKLLKTKKSNENEDLFEMEITDLSLPGSPTHSKTIRVHKLPSKDGVEEASVCVYDCIEFPTGKIETDEKAADSCEIVEKKKLEIDESVRSCREMVFERSSRCSAVCRLVDSFETITGDDGLLLTIKNTMVPSFLSDNRDVGVICSVPTNTPSMRSQTSFMKYATTGDISNLSCTPRPLDYEISDQTFELLTQVRTKLETFLSRLTSDTSKIDLKKITDSKRRKKQKIKLSKHKLPTLLTKHSRHSLSKYDFINPTLAVNFVDNYKQVVTFAFSEDRKRSHLSSVLCERNNDKNHSSEKNDHPKFIIHEKYRSDSIDNEQRNGTEEIPIVDEAVVGDRDRKSTNSSNSSHVFKKFSGSSSIYENDQKTSTHNENNKNLSNINDITRSSSKHDVNDQGNPKTDDSLTVDRKPSTTDERKSSKVSIKDRLSSKANLNDRSFSKSDVRDRKLSKVSIKDRKSSKVSIKIETSSKSIDQISQKLSEFSQTRSDSTPCSPDIHHNPSRLPKSFTELSNCYHPVYRKARDSLEVFARGRDRLECQKKNIDLHEVSRILRDLCGKGKNIPKIFGKNMIHPDVSKRHMEHSNASRRNTEYSDVPKRCTEPSDASRRNTKQSEASRKYMGYSRGNLEDIETSRMYREDTETIRKDGEDKTSRKYLERNGSFRKNGVSGQDFVINIVSTQSVGGNDVFNGGVEGIEVSSGINEVAGGINEVSGGINEVSNGITEVSSGKYEVSSGINEVSSERTEVSNKNLEDIEVSRNGGGSESSERDQRTINNVLETSEPSGEALESPNKDSGGTEVLVNDEIGPEVSKKVSRKGSSLLSASKNSLNLVEDYSFREETKPLDTCMEEAITVGKLSDSCGIFGKDQNISVFVENEIVTNLYEDEIGTMVGDLMKEVDELKYMCIAFSEDDKPRDQVGSVVLDLLDQVYQKVDDKKEMFLIENDERYVEELKYRTEAEVWKEEGKKTSMVSEVIDKLLDKTFETSSDGLSKSSSTLKFIKSIYDNLLEDVFKPVDRDDDNPIINMTTYNTEGETWTRKQSLDRYLKNAIEFMKTLNEEICNYDHVSRIENDVGLENDEPEFDGHFVRRNPQVYVSSTDRYERFDEDRRVCDLRGGYDAARSVDSIHDGEEPTIRNIYGSTQKEDPKEDVRDDTQEDDALRNIQKDVDTQRLLDDNRAALDCIQTLDRTGTFDCTETFDRTENFDRTETLDRTGPLESTGTLDRTGTPDRTGPLETTGPLESAGTFQSTSDDTQKVLENLRCIPDCTESVFDDRMTFDGTRIVFNNTQTISHDYQMVSDDTQTESDYCGTGSGYLRPFVDDYPEISDSERRKFGKQRCKSEEKQRKLEEKQRKSEEKRRKFEEKQRKLEEKRIKSMEKRKKNDKNCVEMSDDTLNRPEQVGSAEEIDDIKKSLRVLNQELQQVSQVNRGINNVNRKINRELWEINEELLVINREKELREMENEMGKQNTDRNERPETNEIDNTHVTEGVRVINEDARIISDDTRDVTNDTRDVTDDTRDVTDDTRDGAEDSRILRDGQENLIGDARIAVINCKSTDITNLTFTEAPIPGSSRRTTGNLDETEKKKSLTDEINSLNRTTTPTSSMSSEIREISKNLQIVNQNFQEVGEMKKVIQKMGVIGEISHGVHREIIKQPRKDIPRGIGFGKTGIHNIVREINNELRKINAELEQVDHVKKDIKYINQNIHEEHIKNINENVANNLIIECLSDVERNETDVQPTGTDFKRNRTDVARNVTDVTQYETFVVQSGSEVGRDVPKVCSDDTRRITKEFLLNPECKPEIIELKQKINEELRLLNSNLREINIIKQEICAGKQNIRRITREITNGETTEEAKRLKQTKGYEGLSQLNGFGCSETTGDLHQVNRDRVMTGGYHDILAYLKTSGDRQEITDQLQEMYGELRDIGNEIEEINGELREMNGDSNIPPETVINVEMLDVDDEQKSLNTQSVDRNDGISNENRRKSTEDERDSIEDERESIKNELLMIGDKLRMIGDKQRITEDIQRITENKPRITESKQRITEDKERIIEGNQRIIEDEQRIIEDNQRIAEDNQRIAEDKERMSEMNEHLEIIEEELDDIDVQLGEVNDVTREVMKTHWKLVEIIKELNAVKQELKDHPNVVDEILKRQISSFKNQQIKDTLQKINSDLMKIYEKQCRKQELLESDRWENDDEDEDGRRASNDERATSSDALPISTNERPISSDEHPKSGEERPKSIEERRTSTDERRVSQDRRRYSSEGRRISTQSDTIDYLIKMREESQKMLQYRVQLNSNQLEIIEYQRTINHEIRDINQELGHINQELGELNDNLPVITGELQEIMIDRLQDDQEKTEDPLRIHKELEKVDYMSECVGGMTEQLSDTAKIIDESAGIRDESERFTDESRGFTDESKLLNDSEVLKNKLRVLIDESKLLNESDVLKHESRGFTDESKLLNESEVLKNESGGFTDESKLLNESEALKNESGGFTDESKLLNESEVLKNESGGITDESKLLHESEVLKNESGGFTDESKLLNEPEVLKNESEGLTDESKPLNESEMLNNESGFIHDKLEAIKDESKVLNETVTITNERNVRNDVSKLMKDELERFRNDSERVRNESERNKNESNVRKDESHVRNDESNLRRDESSVRNDESKLMKDESKRFRNDSEMVRNESERKKDETNIRNDVSKRTKYESGRFRNDSEMARNESRKNKDESNVRNDESKLMKDDSGVVKDDSGVVQDDSGVVKDDSGVVKHESDAMSDESRRVLFGINEVNDSHNDSRKKNKTTREINDNLTKLNDCSRRINENIQKIYNDSRILTENIQKTNKDPQRSRESSTEVYDDSQKSNEPPQIHDDSQESIEPPQIHDDSQESIEPLQVHDEPEKSKKVFPEVLDESRTTKVNEKSRRISFDLSKMTENFQNIPESYETASDVKRGIKNYFKDLDETDSNVLTVPEDSQNFNIQKMIREEQRSIGKELFNLNEELRLLNKDRVSTEPSSPRKVSVNFAMMDEEDKAEECSVIENECQKISKEFQTIQKDCRMINDEYRILFEECITHSTRKFGTAKSPEGSTSKKLEPEQNNERTQPRVSSEDSPKTVITIKAIDDQLRILSDDINPLYTEISDEPPQSFNSLEYRPYYSIHNISIDDSDNPKIVGSLSFDSDSSKYSIHNLHNRIYDPKSYNSIHNKNTDDQAGSSKTTEFGVVKHSEFLTNIPTSNESFKLTNHSENNFLTLDSELQMNSDATPKQQKSIKSYDTYLNEPSTSKNYIHYHLLYDSELGITSENSFQPPVIESIESSEYSASKILKPSRITDDSQYDLLTKLQTCASNPSTMTNTSRMCDSAVEYPKRISDLRLTDVSTEPFVYNSDDSTNPLILTSSCSFIHKRTSYHSPLIIDSELENSEGNSKSFMLETIKPENKSKHLTIEDITSSCLITESSKFGENSEFSKTIESSESNFGCVSDIPIDSEDEVNYFKRLHVNNSNSVHPVNSEKVSDFKILVDSSNSVRSNKKDSLRILSESSRNNRIGPRSDSEDFKSVVRKDSDVNKVDACNYKPCVLAKDVEMNNSKMNSADSPKSPTVPNSSNITGSSESDDSSGEDSKLRMNSENSPNPLTEVDSKVYPVSFCDLDIGYDSDDDCQVLVEVPNEVSEVSNEVSEVSKKEDSVEKIKRRNNMTRNRNVLEDTNIGSDDENLVPVNENLAPVNENLVLEHQNIVSENQNLDPEDKNVISENQNLVPENIKMVSENQNLDLEDKNVISGNQNLVQEDIKLVSENQNLYLEDKNVISENQNLVPEDIKMVSEHKNLVTEGIKMVSENQNLVAEDINVVSENKNLAAEDIKIVSENKNLVREDINVVSENKHLISEDTVTKNKKKIVDKDIIVSENKKVLSESKKVESKPKSMIPHKSKNTVTEKIVLEPNKKLSKTKYKESESKNKKSESKNRESEGENRESESKNKVSENKSRASESKNKVSESKSRESESKNKVSESKNKVSESKNKVLESKNKVSESKNKVSESKNKVSESKNKVSESRIKESESKNISSEDINIEFKGKKVKSESKIKSIMQMFIRKRKENNKKKENIKTEMSITNRIENKLEESEEDTIKNSTESPVVIYVNDRDNLTHEQKNLVFSGMKTPTTSAIALDELLSDKQMSCSALFDQNYMKELCLQEMEKTVKPKIIEKTIPCLSKLQHNNPEQLDEDARILSENGDESMIYEKLRIDIKNKIYNQRKDAKPTKFCFGPNPNSSFNTKFNEKIKYTFGNNIDKNK